MAVRFPFAHTFSIVARDPATGQLGVAVQSHWFSVGGTVAWAAPGAGAVATQAFAEVSYGPRGLAGMRSGASPEQTIETMLAPDPSRELRQVGLVDVKGRTAAHTGARCMAFAGHMVGPGFSVQANMMKAPEVWPAMADAYRRCTGDLAERLLASLAAGQAAGGDVRGRQSAAILVVAGSSSAQAAQDRPFDLRVEDHPDPIGELRRLVTIQRAYNAMNEGDAHLAAGRVEDALDAYRRAGSLEPGNREIAFWTAVTLADVGRVDEALPVFRAVFAAESQWREVLRRLPPTGMVRYDPALLARILEDNG
jgi:uncharacterized Ntn-hydrolase superfamily protein